MTHKAAPNNRFLLCSGVLSFIEYGKVLDNEFKQYNYSCTLRQAPKWLVWALSWVDAQVSCVNNLNYQSLGFHMYVELLYTNSHLWFTLPLASVYTSKAKMWKIF